MHAKLATFLSLVVLLLLCGCLDFEEQGMAYRYDKKTDTLLIFQEYRGISGTDKKASLSKDELEQLDSFVNKQQFYFFANFFWEYDRDTLLEWQKELADPLRKQEVIAQHVGGEAAIQAAERLIELALANVQVTNGPFYFDTKNRLCCVKKIKITSASEMVQAGNEVLGLVVREPVREDAPEEEKKAYAKAIQRRKEFLRLERNQIELYWPMTKADFDKVFGPKAEAVEPESQVIRMVEGFKRSGGKFELVDDELHLSIGNQNETVTRLEMPVLRLGTGGAVYRTNAVEEVKKRAVILEKFDVEAARKEFLK